MQMLEGVDRMNDDDSLGSLFTSSVLSLEDSIHVANALSDLEPVKGKADDIDKKLDKIEDQLSELRLKREENLSVEMEWERREAELFSVAAAGAPKGSRKKRRNAEREEYLKKMAQPKRERNKAVTDGIVSTYHDDVERRARDKPGIGEYDTHLGSLDTRGGRFSTACPKSDVEWQILRASENLMSYVQLPSTLRNSGGSFNKSAKPLTERDWQVKRAKEVPGPGQYDTRPLIERLGQRTGTFSTARPKSDVDWLVHRGKQSPGSHILLPSTLKKSGGTFNKSAKPLTERDWQVKRAKEVPGPGQYKHRELHGPGGGKFNASNSKNDVEWKIYNSQHTPGPGGYDVSRAMEASSQHKTGGGGGRFTMVYRPTEDSKAHLAKGTVEAEEAAAARRHSISLSPLEIRNASMSIASGEEGEGLDGSCGGGGDGGSGSHRRHSNGAPTRGMVLWKKARKLLLQQAKKEAQRVKNGEEPSNEGDFAARGISLWGGGAKGGLGDLAKKSGGMSSLFGVAPGEGDEDENADEDEDPDGKANLPVAPGGTAGSGDSSATVPTPLRDQRRQTTGLLST